MHYDIKVGAITNAQRGSRVLKYKGYKPVVTRISNPKPGDGCGFVLRIEEKDVAAALEILKHNGIRIMGVEQH